MLWYTVILIALTTLPWAMGALGLVYLTSALVLDGLLLRGVVRVLRAQDYVQPAWSVYKFSLLYLALLFVAMVVDRFVSL
jgi:protoheme IX farnesyltransferase